MNKTFSPLLLASLAALVLYGCGEDSTSGSSASGSSSSGSTNPSSVSAGTLALSASSYPVLQSAGTVTATVTRSSGTSGAVSVRYTTSDSSAAAGTDYTAASGTLSWTDGDATSRTVDIAISNATAFSGSKSFVISLSDVSGATLGVSTATVTISGSQTVTSGSLTGLSVVMGTGGAAGRIVNGSGQDVQLRGANRAGSEWTCLYSASLNDHLDQTSIDAMKAWGINAVRVPLNEDCWLGINGAKTTSTQYQSALKTYVDLLTSNGLAVILDLHWAAPGSVLANGQLPMADADHAPTFWSQVATAYASYGSVIFDLFNEPYVTDWDCWLKGAAASANCAVDYDGNAYAVAGMATLLKAVRDTGAQNIVILGGLGYAADFSQWLSKVNSIPSLTSPLNGLTLANVAVSWHTYSQQSVETLCPTQYNNYSLSLTCASGQVSATNYGIPALLAGGYPVIIGEIGISVYSSSTSPYSTTQAQYLADWLDSTLSWMDLQGQSYFGWDWNTVAPPLLISSFDGTPTPYFGTTFKAHLLQQAGT